MRHAPKFDAFVKQRGRPLFGVTDVGLSPPDAIVAVALAREDGVPILGGDVYVLERGRMRPAHANWCTDPLEGESESEFARRSWVQSEEFLRKFPWPEYAEPMIAIVRAE